MPRPKPAYREDEIEEIHQKFPLYGAMGCVICLANGRKPASIRQKAFSEGVYTPTSKVLTPWSDADKADVHLNYEQYGPRGCNVANKRHSDSAIRRWANNEGLKCKYYIKKSRNQGQTSPCFNDREASGV